MAHIFLVYAADDHTFASQLAVQLEQRGLDVWPVPDPLAVERGAPPDPPDRDRAFADASHILGIFSPEALASGHVQERCSAALEVGKHVIAVLHHPVTLPDALNACPKVSFDEPFLLAVESLVKRLKATDAPTRPLTVEHPPPVSKPSLLPIALPSERCWREDRLRINYNLPIVLTRAEMEALIPPFFTATGFELIKATKKQMRGRRKREFDWFDPRRAVHTLTVRRRKRHLQVYYRMTRLQVYHWFPAHYYTLNREAAALYRYLVTGRLDTRTLEPVRRQARRARIFSWLAVLGVLIVPLAIVVLLVL